uniref:Uncharacterized protein n=1 Tax=Amphimedon queenslandica TaxID=400682 RepID=A0A1X7T6V9_AMPQE
MKLQRYIQSLHQELQVAHQNKVSLQEALTEANEQGSKVDGSQLVIMNEKLEEVLQEKQIITEDIEKLRVTVAYNEVYITEIEEEKKQVEEEKRKVEDEKRKVEDENKQAKKEKEQAEEEKRQLEEQYLIDKQITKEFKAKVAVNDVYITELEEENEKVEKQYHKEKQITKKLKTEVADNELYTAKLMKEKEQLQERVTSFKEQSIKKTTSTKEVQFDYMIPSMDNLECLSDVQVAEKKLFLIQGDKPQLMNWEKYGLRIGVQEGSLLSSETVEAAVVALVGGQFKFPPNTVLVSAVYAVSLSKPLLKRLKLEIQHCIDLTGQPDLAHCLKFAIAPVSTPSLPYQFKFVEGGEFSSNGGYGFIERKDFCLVCILGLLIVSMTRGGGGGGQQQQGTGSQGAGVVSAQGGNAPVLQQQPVVNPQTQGEQSQEGEQEQGGDALTVLAQQHQPGTNEQTNGQQGEEVQEEQEQEGEHAQGDQLQKGDQLQSQDGEEEEGDLQREGHKQGGEEERESHEQHKALELQKKQGGQEEDPVDTAKEKENKEHIDGNNILVDNIPVPIKSEAEVLTKPTTETENGKYTLH